MKVAMIARDLQFGIGIHTFQLTRALRNQGVEVDIYTGRGNNLETNLVPLRISDNYDVIHIQGSPFGAFKNHNTPRVTTVHTTLIREWEFEKKIEFFFGKLFEATTFLRADKVIVVNEILRQELEEAYRVPSDKIVCVPNAVDVSEFDKFPEGNRASFVISCGRNIRRKDFPTLTWACKKAKIPLKLFHGNASRVELINAYKNASVFVCSSLYETGPITVLEAMASRCPVVCSNIPAVKDLVTDGKTGLLFKAGDVDDLVWNIQFLMEYPARREEMVETAYEHIKTKYNWENVAKKTIQVYEEVIECG